LVKRKYVTSELTAAGTAFGFFFLFSSSDLTFVINTSTLKELDHVLHNTHYNIFPSISNRSAVDRSKYF